MCCIVCDLEGNLLAYLSFAKIGTVLSPLEAEAKARLHTMQLMWINMEGECS